MSKPASTSPTAENTQLKDIVAHAKEYGFVFQSSEIYDGLAAVYDYGPNGVELKNNLKRLWWDAMTQLNGNVVGIDAAIFMDPRTWEASGHIAGFSVLGGFLPNQYVGAVALLAVEVVDERVVEARHVAASLPSARLLKDGRIDAHHVAVQLGHGLPPQALEVVF